MTLSKEAENTGVYAQMTIEEILSKFPQKAQRLAHAMSRAGLNCVGCHAATWETLEAGVLKHGKSQEDLEKLIGELNEILEEENDPTTISLTKRAAKKFQEILEEEGKLGWGLRFGEQMAGCNGFEYLLDYSEKAEADDETFESHGVQIHVNTKVVKRLLGSEIDFIEGLQGAGFKVSNPNARSSCGCGTSHNY